MNFTTRKTPPGMQPRPLSRTLAARLLALGICWLACGWLTGDVARSEDTDDVRVEKFLTRLGLVDLRTLHLEEVLDGELPAPQRVETAKRLADVYASQLVTHSSDKARYDDVVQRINRLVAKVPEAQTAALKVMLLQADYFRAEKLIGEWMIDRQVTAPRDEAQSILARITPQLMESYRLLKAESDKLQDEIDALEEGDEQAAKEQQSMQLQSVAGRAGYFAGWSSYYLGLVRHNAGGPPATAPNTDYVAARDMFRLLLGLTGEYADEEAEFLGLESVRRAQALIGLGLAEAGVGNLDGSQKCFAWLESGGAPAQVRDEGPYWRLQALLNAGRLDLALDFARQQIAALTSSATSGKVSFCVSLVRAAFAGVPNPTPDLRELGMLGIAGLVKLHQRGPAREMLEKYQINLDDAPGFYLNWIKGQQLTEEAEKSKSPALYQAAVVALERATQADDAQQDLASLGLCQTHLATCYYRLERFEESARMFESAAATRKATGDEKAVDAAWAAFVSYQKLVATQPRFVAAAIDVLQQLKRDYPNHAYAQQADYHIGKLQRSASSPAENLANLEKIAPNNANYLPARYDICIILHGQWKSQTGDGRRAAGDKLLAAANTYLQAASTGGSATQKVKVSSLAASVALDRKPADVGLAESYLSRAAEWAGTLSPSSNVAAEYHYHAMKLAENTKNDSARASHAKWLAEHGQGSPFELSALVTAAKTADAAARLAGDSGPNQAAREAHRIYARLSQLFGDSPQALAEQNNARVAMSKAAQYADQLGDHREAAQRLEKLLDALSGKEAKDKSYVRRAGLANFSAGQFDSAIPHWRTLLAGVKKGSPDWYEAKYYQLACLAKMDPDKFLSVLRQFQVLYPNVPPPWKEKIAALAP